jgi:hypothetical protein
MVQYKKVHGVNWSKTKNERFDKRELKRERNHQFLPHPITNQLKQFTSSRLVYTWIRVNDPSAGSPTETLLRLLLPLNKQVSISFESRRQQTPPKRSVPKTH